MGSNPWDPGERGMCESKVISASVQRLIIPGFLLETRCAVWGREVFGNSSTLSPRIPSSRQGVFHREFHWQLLQSRDPLPLLWGPVGCSLSPKALSHCIPAGTREPGSLPLLEKYGLNPVLSFPPILYSSFLQQILAPSTPKKKRMNPPPCHLHPAL